MDCICNKEDSTFKVTHLVSIVIPCHNNDKYVAEAIQSALDQSYLSKEIIVIDDGSTDQSLKIIKSFGKAVIWQSGSRKGACAARNQGLAISKGEFIKFLDADDVLAKDVIERQVRASTLLNAHDRTIVYGDVINFDELGHYGKPAHSQPCRTGDDPVSHILNYNILTSCPLHRREFLTEVGGFDESLRFSQEYDLHLRLVLAYITFKYVPGVDYYYRQHYSPSKISGAGEGKYGPFARFDFILRLKRLIEEKQGKPLSENTNQALAWLLWRYGRAILREGYSAESKKYFDQAKLLSPKNSVVGSPIYKIACAIGGPFQAEKFCGLLKAFRIKFNQERILK